MRLLIFTPTWVEDGREAMRPECRASIEAQRIAAEWEWRIGTENPFPIGEHRNVLHQYQQAREMFLAGEGEMLLTIEHDHALPDPDAVQRMIEAMAATACSVVYAPYMLRHGRLMLSTWQWINHRNLGMSLSNYPRELQRARAAVIYKISGAGMGCTLFSRKVIEAIPFTPSGARNPCPDLGFAESALRAGYVSMGRFDAPVWHWADGRWLHPWTEAVMKKYRSKVTVNAVAAGRFVHLEAGHVVELSEEEAADLIKVGYTVTLESPPDEQIMQPEIEPPLPTKSEVAIPTSRRNRARTLQKGN